MKILYKSYKYLQRSNIMTKIVIFIILFYFIVSFINKNKQNIEGFIQKEKFILKQGIDVFDDFYVDIYDQLTYEPIKNKFELGELVLLTNMKPNVAKVLDIGSGTGNHLRVLNHNKINVTGIDISPSMVKKTRENYPQINVVQGDVLNSMVFPSNNFTHINCLSMTIYYIKNKKLFFENCFNWLMPGGYLNLHLVNKHKFNPILKSANPLYMISPQKYAKNRITTSLIQFNDFHYKRDFKYNKNDTIAYFEETIKDNKSNKVRKNNHILYMEPQKDILALAKEVGFILKENIDLVNCQHEYEYVYILYKPE
jgi:SAM-dependent methyltransferase